jgi:hypothetical protein
MKIVIYQKGKWEYDRFVGLTTLQENYPLIKRGYKEKRLLLQYRLLYLFKLLLVGEIPKKAILTLDLKGFRDDKESRLTVTVEAINHNKNLSEIQKMVYNTDTNNLTIYCKDLK